MLLVAPSLTKLQSLFKICEIELAWLDMDVNMKNRVVCELEIVLIVTVYISPQWTDYRYRG